MATDLLAEVSPEKLKRAQMLAINKVARDGRAMFAKDVRDQVNLPASYVSANDKRLFVAQQASPSRLEAIIRASGRPVSLARYARNPTSAKRGQGAVVEVAPGRARFMRRAFFIRLRRGAELTDTQFNLGLAIRLRPSERMENKTNFIRMASGLYLLYGPSVDQVFRSVDGDGIATDRAPLLAEKLEREFLRLLEL
jgi:hypothetical protein